MIDLDAIRERTEQRGIFHLTHEPCQCGLCNPANHPRHARHEEMIQLYSDIEALLDEIRLLREREVGEEDTGCRCGCGAAW